MDTEFYASLLDQIPDGVYVVDLQRRISYWNDGAARITGYSADEVVGHSCADGILRHVNEAGRELCLRGCPLAAVMADGRPREANVYLHHKDGQRIAVTVRGRALRDAAGTIIGSGEVFSVRDTNPYVDRRRPPTDDSVDGMTGLATRRLGEFHLETLTRAVSESAATLGVLFVDADHFKDVNDTFGHRTGDDVLHMVGQSVAAGLRRGDVPIRWGGEELVVLLPGIDLPGLLIVAERVRMLVESSWIQKDDIQVRVTVSVGATLALPGEGPTEVVDRADRLMYGSKGAGRNRVTSDPPGAPDPDRSPDLDPAHATTPAEPGR